MESSHAKVFDMEPKVAWGESRDIRAIKEIQRHKNIDLLLVSC